MRSYLWSSPHEFSSLRTSSPSRHYGGTHRRSHPCDPWLSAASHARTGVLSLIRSGGGRSHRFGHLTPRPLAAAQSSLVGRRQSARSCAKGRGGACALPGVPPAAASLSARSDPPPLNGVARGLAEVCTRSLSHRQPATATRAKQLAAALPINSKPRRPPLCD